MSTFGGNDLSATPPKALLSILAGSPVTTKGEQHDQLRCRHLVVDIYI